MANARKYAGSTFISLKDLKNKPPLLERISYAKEEDGKFGEKLVLFFESGLKLSLNATSVGNLIRDIDQDYDNWTGHDVKVFAGEVDFKNGKADAVVVEPIDVDRPIPESRKAVVERSPSKPVDLKSGGGVRRSSGDMDDEIPF